MEASCKKWPENGSDLNNDEYELPILKYDANQDKLVEQKGKPPKRRGRKNPNGRRKRAKNTIAIGI
jgi:hypothetical protein